jgi:hypothetical protein
MHSSQGVEVRQAQQGRQQTRPPRLNTTMARLNRRRVIALVPVIAADQQHAHAASAIRA